MGATRLSTGLLLVPVDTHATAGTREAEPELLVVELAAQGQDLPQRQARCWEELDDVLQIVKLTLRTLTIWGLGSGVMDGGTEAASFYTRSSPGVLDQPAEAIMFYSMAKRCVGASLCSPSTVWSQVRIFSHTRTEGWLSW
jgi:hypothetical protein